MKLSSGEVFRLVTLALLRLSATWAVHAGGIVALSDDDYARVVIAERFAASPSLDPSGTSWLPFPFWVTGSAMRLAGSSLEVARGAQAILAVLAIWLLYAGAKLAGLSPRTAFWGAAWAAILPLSLVLGSATVPELPTAALCAFSLLALSRRTPMASLLAGLAIVPATLSRYEAWPVAAVVALVLLFDGLRSAVQRSSPRVRLLQGGAAFLGAGLSVLGPAAWIAWNHRAHGDALHFLRRVSAYREALGVGPEAWASYLLAIATGCLTVCLPLFCVFLVLRRSKLDTLARWKRPGLGVLAMLAFLLMGALVGGAPTHHPSRTLLTVWLLGAVALIDWLRALRWPPLHVQGFVANGAVVGFALLMGLGVFWDTHHVLRDPMQRAEEEQLGKELRKLVPEGERVLVSTEDYGYFAVMAAFGRPHDVEVDRTHDPRAEREASVLANAETMRAAFANKRVRFVVARELPEGVREVARNANFVIGKQ